MNALTEQNKIVTTESVLDEAIFRCLQEMYYHSQPSINLRQLQKEAKEKGIKVDFIDKCYLSKEMYNTIVDKYIQAYHLDNYFSNDIELLLDYLDHPYVKDYSKGYKTHKKLRKLREKIGKDDFEIVKDYINNAKEYYNRNMDAEVFRFNVANYGPTSNKQRVIDYWKTQGKNIEIKDFTTDEIFNLTYFGEIEE